MDRRHFAFFSYDLDNFRPARINDKRRLGKIYHNKTWPSQNKQSKFNAAYLHLIPEAHRPAGTCPGKMHTAVSATPAPMLSAGKIYFSVSVI